MRQVIIAFAAPWQAVAFLALSRASPTLYLHATRRVLSLFISRGLASCLFPSSLSLVSLTFCPLALSPSPPNFLKRGSHVHVAEMQCYLADKTPPPVGTYSSPMPRDLW